MLTNNAKLSTERQNTSLGENEQHLNNLRGPVLLTFGILAPMSNSAPNTTAQETAPTIHHQKPTAQPSTDLERELASQIKQLLSEDRTSLSPVNNSTSNQLTLAEKHGTGTTERTPFGIGWLSDSLAFGLAVTIDAAALMYTRSKRLLSSDTERKDEKELRQKIAVLHVAAPLAPFAAGYFVSDALIATGSLLGTVAVTTLYTAAGAIMYAFANNVLREEAGISNDAEGEKGLFRYIENGVNKFGEFLINKMPSQTWAIAMGVTVDAVISGLKFVQSSGWSTSEVVLSCGIAGTVVYGLITGAQKFGAHQISTLSKDQSLNTDQQLNKVTDRLSQATAAGFFAFRYFAWTGFMSAALTASGAAVNEWGLRAAALGLAIGHGLKSVRSVWPQLKKAKQDDAEQFVGRREVEELNQRQDKLCVRLTFLNYMFVCI